MLLTRLDHSGYIAHQLCSHGVTLVAVGYDLAPKGVVCVCVCVCVWRGGGGGGGVLHHCVTSSFTLCFSLSLANMTTIVKQCTLAYSKVLSLFPNGRSVSAAGI